MLTDAQIRKAKPCPKLLKLADGRGLYLAISPAGKKTWRATYRVGSASKTATFGDYPEISLADARNRVADLKKELKKGVDPFDIIDGAKFGDVAEEMVARKQKSGKADRTIESNRLLLRHLNDLNDRNLQSIKPHDIMTIIRRIEEEGKRETARRVRGIAGAVFRYAASTGRAESDPTALLKGALLPVSATPRAAITDPQRFGTLLTCIDHYDGWPTIRSALQFAALTFSRPGEIRQMKWAQVQDTTWHIPDDILKQRRPHQVPLSRQALAVLARMRRLGRDPLVFPSLRPGCRPLSENTLNAALRTLGFAKDEHTAHGFRASASTMLNEKGYRKDVIEAQLSHLDEDEVRRAYNRASYWPERVKMMQEWADYLDDLKMRDAV